MILDFKYGFWYKDRLFVWHQKKLYRYPFESNHKFYVVKEIEPKNGKYRLCRDWVGIQKLKSLTTAVDVEPVSIVQHEDCPF